MLFKKKKKIHSGPTPPPSKHAPPMAMSGSCVGIGSTSVPTFWTGSISGNIGGWDFDSSLDIQGSFDPNDEKLEKLFELVIDHTEDIEDVRIVRRIRNDKKITNQKLTREDKIDLNQLYRKFKEYEKKEE